MTSNFLHEDKALPPDEAAERKVPRCPSCNQPMWLVRTTTKSTDGGEDTINEYKCKLCGREEMIGDNKMDEVMRECPL
jgi:transposase-like protein